MAQSPRISATWHENPLASFRREPAAGCVNTGLRVGRRPSARAAHRRERMGNRTPSGASTEDPLPRNGTRSTVSCVCCQYLYCSRDIQNGMTSIDRVVAR
jgi:hypothetical protein